MSRLTQSYVHGASSTPLLGETIGALLRRTVADGPDRPALVTRHQNVRLSYADLLRRSEDLAVGLTALGLKKGDRVGIWSQNNSEWVLAQFGTALAGLILVNINPAYRAYEFDYAIKKSGCRALILSPGHKNNDYFASLRASAPEIDAAEPGRLRSENLPALEFVIRLGAEKTPGMLNFDEVAAPASEPEREALAAFGATLQFDDPINIQFTSGTTGTPKGATLTHHNIVNNGYFIGEAMRLTADDRLCIPVPYYHCFGMVLGNLACVTHGSCMVSPAEGFDPRGDARGGRGRGLHRAPRRADHVHRHARSSRVRAFRSEHAAHRHHGRLALSGRGDAPGGRAHAHARGDDRLRHDRDEPGQLPERLRRSARAPRLDGRAHPAAYRGQDRRRRRPHRSAGRSGRAPDPRL